MPPPHDRTHIRWFWLWLRGFHEDPPYYLVSCHPHTRGCMLAEFFAALLRCEARDVQFLHSRTPLRQAFLLSCQLFCPVERLLVETRPSSSIPFMPLTRLPPPPSFTGPLLRLGPDTLGFADPDGCIFMTGWYVRSRLALRQAGDPEPAPPPPLSAAAAAP
ncbi:MAG: hypothetical protein GY772_06490 [bacterium]|nr:hypothetical protein [bacterium]